LKKNLGYANGMQMQYYMQMLSLEMEDNIKLHQYYNASKIMKIILPFFPGNEGRNGRKGLFSPRSSVGPYFGSPQTHEVRDFFNPGGLCFHRCLFTTVHHGRRDFYD
jgi:hypothetical protein